MDTRITHDDLIDRAMTLAQEFASSWSLVGGPFDFGNGLENAEAAKAELEKFLQKHFSHSKAAPEGYALTPVQPTSEMLNAGYRAIRDVEQKSTMPRLCFNAMIGAAEFRKN